MKKNLITVIILALCIINLIFNILLVFVFMPSTTKTNKLITDIAQIIDLEIASQASEEGAVFDVSNLDQFQLEQGNPINLANDGTGEIHVIQYGVTINLDKTASDYTKISTSMTASTSMIYDICSEIIAQYTYSEVTDVEVKKEIKNLILEKLRETSNSECIYSLSFYNWVAQ